MTAGSNWPISVLSSAFGPHLDSRKLNMAICVGYLEANEQDVPATLTVTGLVSPKAKWQSFEDTLAASASGRGADRVQRRATSSRARANFQASAGCSRNADRVSSRRSAGWPPTR